MLIGQFAIMPQDKHCVYHFKECLDLLKLYIFKNRHEMLLGTICQHVATKSLRVPSQGMFKFIQIVPPKMPEIMHFFSQENVPH